VPRLIQANQSDPTLCQVYFQIPAADGISPALGEAGGQPQISVNGGAWTSTGISTLVAIGFGRYYATLIASAVANAGDEIETRYSSATTAETPGETVLVVYFDPSQFPGGSSQRLIQVDQSDPTQCQVYWQLVGTDGISPALSEAGGQPQISLAGAAWTSTGISTLTAIGDGRYYATLSTSVLNTPGMAIETRYASASTAECPGDSVLVVGYNPLGMDIDADSVGQILENWVLSVLQGLSFNGVAPTSIVARKLPEIGEALGVDPPAILLAPAVQDEEREFVDFESDFQVSYTFEICRVAASNRDFSPDPYARQFQQLIRQAFVPQDISAAPGVWTIEVEIGHLYDRSTLNSQYSYTSMLVKFLSEELGG
jgi:hypothetical protein